MLRVLALLAALAMVTLSGCGTASEPSPPTGVDGLVIPTPSVDPDDFVTGVDNPWFPLAAGASWTYEVTGPAAGTRTVSVREETASVAGVRATVVETTTTESADDGGWAATTSTTDYYAQDRDGNVWWLGREGVWQAGEAGAEAGLAMPRTPRLGDGWRRALLTGVVEDRAEVTSLSGAATTPAGRFERLVELATSTPLEPGVELVESYARGIGLVRTIATEGPAYAVELVSGP